MKRNNNENFFWDKSKIDISDLYDMEYWSFLWGTSKEQILESVTETGTNNTEIIEQHLIQKGVKAT